MSDVLPVILPKSGAQPQLPAALRAKLILLVQQTNPGYTANLPGSLIEDVSSTNVGAVSLCDQALVDLINSLTPYGANQFLMTQLGNVCGVLQNVATNTSVSVVFAGAPGQVIAKDFVVSDGTYQYTALDGGIVESGGYSQPLFFVANLPGSWVVLPYTVTQVVTALPAGLTSFTNPLAGTPGADPEDPASYRARVLQAGLAVCQGAPQLAKTLLAQITGVQVRLISVRVNPSGLTGYEVICGGGDPYAVAYAIFQAFGDLTTLIGSTLQITAVSSNLHAQLTTSLNHGYVAGQTGLMISGALGMTALNGGPYTVNAVVSPTAFTINFDSTSQPAYAGGGSLTPVARNQVVTIQDTPDVYEIPFVNPPQQSVQISLTWNTTATNFVSDAAVAQLGAPALVTYVNSIYVGQPINLFELQEVFAAAINSILPQPLLTRMIFTVSINNVGVSPVSGTGVIQGDPESYFLTDPTQISIVRG